MVSCYFKKFKDKKDFEGHLRYHGFEGYNEAFEYANEVLQVFSRIVKKHKRLMNHRKDSNEAFTDSTIITLQMDMQTKEYNVDILIYSHILGHEVGNLIIGEFQKAIDVDYYEF